MDGTKECISLCSVLYLLLTSSQLVLHLMLRFLSLFNFQRSTHRPFPAKKRVWKSFCASAHKEQKSHQERWSDKYSAFQWGVKMGKQIGRRHKVPAEKGSSGGASTGLSIRGRTEHRKDGWYRPVHAAAREGELPSGRNWIAPIPRVPAMALSFRSFGSFPRCDATFQNTHTSIKDMARVHMRQFPLFDSRDWSAIVSL